jgi:hypothetical protein
MEKIIHFPQIIDTRTAKGPREPGSHSIHPDGDPDCGVFSGEVTDWIQNQLEHMISPRGNDAEDAAGDLCERLAGIVLEMAKDVAAKKRIKWMQAELRQDRQRNG